MKNCTKHAIERWVERIVGITTKLEKEEYIKNNLEQIKEHINKTFSYSKFIYKGQIGDNITRNFYIKDDIVLVLNTTNDAVITVYKVDFGFTKEINLSVAKQLLVEITKLIQEKEKIEEEMTVEIERLQNENELLNNQISILEKQLEELKLRKKSTEDYIKSKKASSNVIDLEIKKFINNLVNSKEYREDVKKQQGVK